VRAVAAGDVLGVDDLIGPVRVAQRGDDGIRGGAQVYKFGGPLDGDVERTEVVAKDSFGLRLGQEQQVRVGGVVEAEVEQRHRQLSAASVHAQLHGRVAVGDQHLGHRLVERPRLAHPRRTLKLGEQAKLHATPPNSRRLRAALPGT